MDGRGHQQPIEDSVFRAAVGVAMDPGQMLHRQTVFWLDSKFLKTLLLQAVTQLSSVDEESGLAEGGFDRHLPKAHNAVQQRQAAIAEVSTQRCR